MMKIHEFSPFRKPYLWHLKNENGTVKVEEDWSPLPSINFGQHGIYNFIQQQLSF